MNRHGIWNFAGMAGALTGLSIVEALASVPADCDVELCRRFFVIGETAFVESWRKHERDKEPTDADK